MEIVIIVGLILLNGVLSMSEIAMVSARKSRLEADVKKGSKAAKTALKLANAPDTFLSTIQIGITLIGILTGLYSGEVLAQSFGKVIALIKPLEAHAVAIAQTLIVIIVTYLTLIIGELVPKRIGMSASERVAKLVARPMNLLSKIALPFVWILSKSTVATLKLLGVNTQENNKVTEDEIKAIIQEGTDGGEIQEVEQDIVERVFNLGDRNVGSIMTHRSEMVWLNVNYTKEQIEETVKNNLFKKRLHRSACLPLPSTKPLSRTDDVIQTGTRDEVAAKFSTSFFRTYQKNIIFHQKRKRKNHFLSYT